LQPCTSQENREGSSSWTLVLFFPSVNILVLHLEVNMTQALVLKPLVSLQGKDLTGRIERMYQSASDACEVKFAIDWHDKSDQEREAIVWVEMLERTGTMEDEVFQLRGYILAHIQDEDLIRYHPGRSNWSTLTDMVADRINTRTLSPGEQCDLAFVVADITPAIQRLELGSALAPSLSVVRALIPSIRITMRRHDDEGLRELLTRSAEMTFESARALTIPPESKVQGQAYGSGPASPLECKVIVTPTQFAKLRRSTPWIEWEIIARQG
jgi:hypothetical protein